MARMLAGNKCQYYAAQVLEGLNSEGTATQHRLGILIKYGSRPNQLPY